ncbi:hypothetical protein Y900_009360 [Mycolicibacterium aromaticivorans JS19b1 = JCM 16368]|uniref:Mycothiol-dependent maleylpyruvate isomerase metal-binding domain-containing protein n=1 Tax=Mycolicibacterium aromaticivorans JS19b1 = JCM 16368 TaxID=1440774 RepID=A0A064CK98_9MYCO|nr:maleylpyruvate isomerase family mycothiol-dependent enzyme [Mycolicibacterium aromaticivorans]KDE99153.1 hypothetical protein Y900_009360 [Mycolicibacterium aromaticivorans JS19b1 = JCM 16368]
MTLQAHAETFRRAGDHAVSVAEQIRPDQWDSPALGTWSVRTLVGHIGRSFTTVIDYSSRPADQLEVTDSAQYYLVIAPMLTDSTQIDARAVQAGLALGERPLDTLRELRDRAVAVLNSEDRAIQTIAGGMRLSDYLPTRIFELGVHSIDLARAIGAPQALPPDIADSILALSVAVAQRRGDSQELLCALTGRGALAPDYSIV